MNKQNPILLYLGIGLVVFALGSKFNLIPNFGPINIPSVVVIDDSIKPNDPDVLAICEDISDIIRNSSSSDKQADVANLGGVYMEIANLIDMDEEVVTNTQQVRASHIIAAKLLRINLSGKYDGLAEESNKLFSQVLGNDDVALDDTKRQQAVKAFKYLSWALQKGV